MPHPKNYPTCQRASRIQASPWCELGGRSTLPEKYLFIFCWYEFGSQVDSHQLLISPHYLSSKALQLWLSALLLVQTLPVEHLEIISLELCWWRTWPFQAHLVHMCTTGCNETVCTFYTWSCVRREIKGLPPPPFAEYRSDPLLLMNFKLAELGSAFEKRRFRRNCSPLHN